MLKGILSFIGGLFTSDKATDTIIDIVRDKTGVDELKDKERVDALLQYIDKTKHQSKTRRFLAVATMIGIMLFTGTWLLVSFVEASYVFLMTDTTSISLATSTSNTAKIAVQPLIQFKNGIVNMLVEFMKQPFSIVFGFYFGSQLLTQLNKRDK